MLPLHKLCRKLVWHTQRRPHKLACTYLQPSLSCPGSDCFTSRKSPRYIWRDKNGGTYEASMQPCLPWMRGKKYPVTFILIP